MEIKCGSSQTALILLRAGETPVICSRSYMRSMAEPNLDLTCLDSEASALSNWLHSCMTGRGAVSSNRLNSADPSWFSFSPVAECLACSRTSGYICWINEIYNVISWLNSLMLLGSEMELKDVRSAVNSSCKILCPAREVRSLRINDLLFWLP